MCQPSSELILEVADSQSDRGTLTITVADPSGPELWSYILHRNPSSTASRSPSQEALLVAPLGILRPIHLRLPLAALPSPAMDARRGAPISDWSKSTDHGYQPDTANHLIAGSSSHDDLAVGIEG